MEEKTEPKMVSMACYGWNKEKQCVEFQLLINEEIYVMPVYKKDVRGMEQFFLVNEKNSTK
ncbi:hypothetical protein CN923_28740 [Bacillus cereus]|nr:hypothetical protein COM83_10750 [Bacillus cereus]PEA28276.1 hypothetical protein CON44_05510 [Bacillus cereus]PEQ26589.1 hypothetical protein CN467_30780 [Bacillus cereus]PER18189.1 hypothetical protein CN485_28340 [Bacillus cereus]PEY87823.1 hypothetical protein CN349_28495 [Bacillus cereus]